MIYLVQARGRPLAEFSGRRVEELVPAVNSSGFTAPSHLPVTPHPVWAKQIQTKYQHVRCYLRRPLARPTRRSRQRPARSILSPAEQIHSAVLRTWHHNSKYVIRAISQSDKAETARGKIG